MTTKKYIYFFLFPLIIITTLTGCISREQTPTPDPNQIITQVAQTIHAEMTLSVTLTPATPSTTSLSTLTPSGIRPEITSPNLTTTIAIQPGAPTGQAPDHCVWLEDLSVPDGTVFYPNESSTKIWKVQNLGTTTWNINYKLVYLDGTIISEVLSFPLSKPVEPGNIINLSVPMKAPNAVGSYTSQWKMMNDQGQFFGDLLYVQFIVATTKESTPTASG